MAKELFYGCECRCTNLMQDDDGSWKCLAGWFSDGDASEVYQQCGIDCEDFDIGNDDEYDECEDFDEEDFNEDE